MIDRWIHACLHTYIEIEIYVDVHIYISHIWMEVFYNWGFLYVYNLWSCWPRNNKALKESAVKMIYLFFKCAAKKRDLSYVTLTFAHFQTSQSYFLRNLLSLPPFCGCHPQQRTPSWLVVIDLPATLLIPTEQLDHTGMLRHPALI